YGLILAARRQITFSKQVNTAERNLFNDRLGRGVELLSDAKMLEELGCFGVVLEKIPASLAQKVAESIRIPVIGIGAGNHVDGQVLVLHDMLGMSKEFSPRFLRRYADLHQEITQAVTYYTKDVKSGDFPNEKEQY
ncbi:MAG: 3-methyl-2-oxobutanoate hydroxymethyltransferase, partial [Flavobacteriaceae bacterium]